MPTTYPYICTIDNDDIYISMNVEVLTEVGKYHGRLRIDYKET